MNSFKKMMVVGAAVLALAACNSGTTESPSTTSSTSAEAKASPVEEPTLEECMTEVSEIEWEDSGCADNPEVLEMMEQGAVYAQTPDATLPDFKTPSEFYLAPEYAGLFADGCETGNVDEKAVEDGVRVVGGYCWTTTYGDQVSMSIFDTPEEMAPWVCDEFGPEQCVMGERWYIVGETPDVMDEIMAIMKP